MGKIIVAHSFRGGTGKSSIIANLAACLACRGHRVCIVDTDVQSPGVHVFFGLKAEDTTPSLNEYLWGRCTIEEAARDVSERLSGVSGAGGRVFLVPSSIGVNDITRILKEGYEVSALSEGFSRIMRSLNLDYLLIDTHPGIGEESLLSLAISDVLLIIMRPDYQDYQGTSVTLEVCRRLEVPRPLLVVNKLLAGYDARRIAREAEKTYLCEVAAVLPQSDDLMRLESKSVIYTSQRDHPISREIDKIADRIAAVR
ncbi:MAG: antiporter inner membrane protein [Methanosaeta sp. PtaU1.Bin112]|nr:MAG: antiporter inner membrane protein [Methanosaeta sp. PtaU1.Bin112]